jgi:hypothetical protein
MLNIKGITFYKTTPTAVSALELVSCVDHILRQYLVGRFAGGEMRVL